MQKNGSLLNYLDTAFIDRMTDHRQDNARLVQLLEEPSTRIVPVWRDMNLISNSGEDIPEAVFPTFKEFPMLNTEISPEILLGRDTKHGRVYFAVELPERDDTVPETFSLMGRFESPRGVTAIIDRDQAALLAYARGMVTWHGNHRFCGICGNPTNNSAGGHARICTGENCQRQHFPRTDPAVIVLVADHDDEYCLLGRAAHWPKGVYSTLAGFVEPGESLELTVVREVLEESGVRVEPDRVIYHSSQPWPFPSSIMLGFTARTQFQEIRIDSDELEDARWFSRADIESALEAGTFRLPSVYSIANRLIEDWRNKKN